MAESRHRSLRTLYQADENCVCESITGFYLFLYCFRGIGRINPSPLKNHPHSTGCSPRYSSRHFARCGGRAGEHTALARRILDNSSLQADRYPRQLLPALPYLLPPCSRGAYVERRHACCVFLRCVKQDGMRWCPALVQRSGFRAGGLLVQLSEYLFDDRRVFDADNRSAIRG
jgi:hypothetical protein